MIPQETIEKIARIINMTMDNNPRDPRSSEGLAKGITYF
jgi:hypothetical protein